LYAGIEAQYIGPVPGELSDREEPSPAVVAGIVALAGDGSYNLRISPSRASPPS
jgi:hypothetical protein